MPDGAVKSSSEIPPRLKYVATLACEIFVSFFTRTRNKGYIGFLNPNDVRRVRICKLIEVQITAVSLSVYLYVCLSVYVSSPINLKDRTFILYYDRPM